MGLKLQNRKPLKAYSTNMQQRCRAHTCVAQHCTGCGNPQIRKKNEGKFWNGQCLVLFQNKNFPLLKIPLLVQRKFFLVPTLGQPEVAAGDARVHTIKEEYAVCRVEYFICLPNSRLFDKWGASRVSALISQTSFTLLH